MHYFMFFYTPIYVLLIGYASLEGLEKICRPMCALPNESDCRKEQSNTLSQCCPNNPVMGGKHQKPSTYCSEHIDTQDENTIKS